MGDQGTVWIGSRKFRREQFRRGQFHREQFHRYQFHPTAVSPQDSFAADKFGKFVWTSGFSKVNLTLYSPHALITWRPEYPAGQFLDDSNSAGQFPDVSYPAGHFLDVSNPAGQFLDVSYLFIFFLF